MRPIRLLFQAAALGAVLALAAPGAAADAAAGAELARARCAPCHGNDGRGIAQDYPSLAGQHPDYIVKQIFNFKTGLRTSALMGPVVNELKASDIRALSAHFGRLPAGRIPPADAALAAAGRAIYHDGRAADAVAACASCHGPVAAGSANLPRLAGQNPVYLFNQLRGFAQKARVNDRMMHVGLEKLPESDLRALAAFLGGVE